MNGLAGRRPTTTRRQFLLGLGITSASLLSPLALVRAARAAAPAQRVVFVYIPDGCIPSLFHPTGSEFDFTLQPMTEPLAAVKQHCTFLDGLRMYEGGATHEGGIRKVLTANAAQSLDDFLGDQVGMETPFRSVYLGVGANYENGSGGFSFLQSGIAQAPDDNPLNAFARLFGESSAPGGNEINPASSILDHAIGEVNQLMTRLGNVERQRLENHLDALREVENRFATENDASCASPGWNEAGFTVPEGWHGYPPKFDREEHFRTVGQLQMDLIVEALACDLTRVAALQWSHPVSPTLLSWTGASQRHHDASHYGNPSTSSAQDFILSQRFFVEQFANLLVALASREDPTGDGTLLDHTRVLLFSELGDSNLHDHTRVPFVLAGAPNEFTGGRLLSFENESHAKLLVSLARSMQVPIDSYGYSGHGTGGLSGL